MILILNQLDINDVDNELITDAYISSDLRLLSFN